MATEEVADELTGRLKTELDDEAELPRAADGTVRVDPEDGCAAG
jgi:hypothetical protein